MRTPRTPLRSMAAAGHDARRVHVNVFETAVAQALGLPAQMCTSAPICGKALAVEHDGSLYSYDHFVYAEYKLGNIRDTHEGDLAFSRKQIEFGLAKRDGCRRTVADASSYRCAGASARRTACCAPLTARPASTTCAKA